MEISNAEVEEYFNRCFMNNNFNSRVFGDNLKVVVDFDYSKFDIDNNIEDLQ